MAFGRLPTRRLPWGSPLGRLRPLPSQFVVDGGAGGNGAASMPEVVFQLGAFSGAANPGERIGIDQSTAPVQIYVVDVAGNWQLFSAETELKFDTLAERPLAPDVMSGTRALILNDGPNSGEYLALGPVGSPGTAWLKTST